MFSFEQKLRSARPKQKKLLLMNFEVALNQGCQIVYFQTKNPKLGKFWRVLQWNMLVYFMTIWAMFRPFGLFMTLWYMYFVIIWYIL
jgi:hypothetical protein